MDQNKDFKDYSEEDWKAVLDPESFEVLRLKGTERPFSGEFVDYHGDGVFVCKGCKTPLFDAGTKFESGSGWPSFYDCIDSSKIKVQTDRSHFMVRKEILCANCNGHLGHVFEDGPEPTGLRYCVNSASLDLKDAAQ